MSGIPKDTVNTTANSAKRKHSAETRAKIAAGVKRAWAKAEKRASLSAGQKKAWDDPEIKARRRVSLSRAAKKAWADPEKRAQRLRARGALSDADREALIARFAAGERARDLAEDFLISVTRVYAIAAAVGVRRRGRRKKE